MKQRIRFAILFLFIGIGITSQAEILYYTHEGLHLKFALDTDTKEATLGTGLDLNELCAIALPPRDDPWWDESPSTNYWANLDIPSTIVCEGTARTYFGDIVSIPRDTYTVTAVSYYAFYKSSRIQTVHLPETIREIGSNAFTWCVNLKSINIPSQVKTIEAATFWYCKKLETIKLPDHLKKISYMAFSDCMSLKEITIPGECDSIGNDAFTWCPNIRKVTIADGTGVLKVGYAYNVGFYDDRPNPTENYRSLFADCPVDTLYLGRNIICPHVPKSNKTLSPFAQKLNYMQFGDYHYTSNGSFESLKFGNTVTDIADSLFCEVLLKKEFILPGNLKRIGNAAFFWGPTAYIDPRRVEIPQSVEVIGDNAFRNNYLTEVILHEGLQSIGNNAFYDNKISSLTIPSTVVNFGNQCFGKNVIERLELADGLKTMCSINDAKIVKLTIPASIENIGGDFGESLKFVYCLPPTPPEGGIGNDAVVFVPAGKGQLYRSHGWSNIVDPDDEQITINVKKVGTLYSRLIAQDYTINDVLRLKLKGTLNSDDWATISNMANLYYLDLSEVALEELPSGYFLDKTKLNKIIFPNALKTIEDNAFTGCIHLEGVVDVPANCTSVGTRAFYGLSINGVRFNGNTNVQAEAFMGCYVLDEVNLAAGMVVGKNAFSSTALEELNVPANVTIDDNAFNITSLKKVTFSGGGQELGNEVFSNSVEKFVFNGVLKSIGSFATGVEKIDVDDIRTWCKLPFIHPVSIDNLSINGEEATNIIIPDDIKELRKNLFYECPTIHSVQLPDDITEIPEQTFYGCENLSAISFPAKLEIVGNSAFNGCVGIQEIVLPSKVKTLGQRAFYSCEKLSQIEIPSTVTLIGEGVFSGCGLLKNVILPDGLLELGERAFSQCSSLEKVDLPVSITSVGEYVFDGCDGLTMVVAHWKDPIAVNNVGGNCLLYVPIGTSQKYVNEGWNFTNIKETGILTVLVIGNGKVAYDSEVVSAGKKDFYFKPYRDFNLQFNPNTGFKIMKAILNGENILSSISDGEYLVEEPEEDFNLIVVFDDASILQGDVNADRVINASDAEGIANYILKCAPEQFHDYWADMNGDGIIDITDIILVISKYTVVQ